MSGLRHGGDHDGRGDRDRRQAEGCADTEESVEVHVDSHLVGSQQTDKT
jgi:hypothetical protein